MSLPLGFVVFGLVCLAAVVGLLLVRPTILSTYHYNQYVVAATHLVLLGWVGSVVFGALYQLVPVALESRLFSERLARLHLALHVVGVSGMVWSFWHWNLKHVGHWASVFAAGIALLLFNVVRTVIRSRKWTPVSVGIGSALGWLSAAVLVGLAIAAAKCSYESIDRLADGHPLAVTLRGLEWIGSVVARFDQISLMHAHAHLGVLGCFVILVVSVSWKLLPMFLLSDVQSERRAWWVIGLLNLGLAGQTAAVAFRSPWKPVFTGVLVFALILYGWEVRALLKARGRRKVDVPLRMFLGSLTVLIPLGALAAVLSWPGLPLNALTGQLENLYGFLAVFGLLSIAILGMLYKILPFLVWYGTYSPHVGRATLPTLAEMYEDRLVVAGGIAFLVALSILAIAILLSSAPLVRWGGSVLAVAVALHGTNYAMILRHRIRPRMQPLPAG